MSNKIITIKHLENDRFSLINTQFISVISPQLSSDEWYLVIDMLNDSFNRYMIVGQLAKIQESMERIRNFLISDEKELVIWESEVAGNG